MRTSDRFNIKNIGSLISVELKRILSSLPTLFLMIIIISLSISVLITIDSNRGLSFDKTVAIVDDDKSLEVKMFLKNITSNKLKNILNFKNLELDKAKEMLESKDISAIIHIEKGTFKQLDYGKKANINVYYRNKSDIVVNFMINYMENLISVLNHGQSGAMIYWDIMKDNGYTYKQRLDSLNGIFIDYVKSFMTRGGLIKEETFTNYKETSFIEFYFIGLIIIITILFTYGYYWDLESDIDKGLIMRKIYSGYRFSEIIISKTIIGGIYMSAFIILMYTFFYRFIDHSMLTLNFYKVLGILLYSIVLNLFMLMLYFIRQSKLKRNLILIGVTLILIYTSGLIVPVRALPSLLYKLRYLNIIYSVQGLLIFNGTSILSLGVLIAYLCILIFTITSLYRKRWLSC